MQFKFNFIINIHFFQKEKRRSNDDNSAFWPLEQEKIAILPNPGSSKPMNVIQMISQGGLTSGKAAKPAKRNWLSLWLHLVARADMLTVRRAKNIKIFKS